jgi:hypothetical protein
MLTRENKIGLVIALLLGLSDIAILAALTGNDTSAKPPVWIVVLSVVVGVATVVLVAMAWRAPTRPVMLAIIALRVVSGLGDLVGFTEGGGGLVISAVLLLVTIVCIALLWNWVRREQTQHAGHHRAGAVG